MTELLEKCNWKAVGTFACGVLFGTAGVKVLSSSDAKKFYTNCTAAALRARDCVMATTTKIQENAEDILEEAKEINRAKACQEIISDSEEEEDFSETGTPEAL